MVGNQSNQVAGFLQNLNPQQLIGALKSPPPGVPLYLIMSEQLRRQNMQKQALATPNGPPPQTTVADDLFQSGIAGMPQQSMAVSDSDDGIASLVANNGNAIGANAPDPMQMMRRYASGGRVGDDDEDEKHRHRGYPSGGPLPPWQGFNFRDKVVRPIVGPLMEQGRGIGNNLREGAGMVMDIVTGKPSLPAFTGKSPINIAPPVQAQAQPEAVPNPEIVQRPVDAPIAPPQPQVEAPIAETPPRELPVERSKFIRRGVELSRETGLPPELATIFNPELWSKAKPAEDEMPQAPEKPAIGEFLDRMNAFNPDVMTPKMLERLEKKEAALEEARAKAGPMALIQTGLAIMAGNSKSALQNIARGGLAGLQMHAQTQAGFTSREDELDDLRMRLLSQQQKHKVDNLNTASNLRRDEFAMDDRAYDNKWAGYKHEVDQSNAKRKEAIDTYRDQRDFNQRAAQHKDNKAVQYAQINARTKAEKKQDERTALAARSQFRSEVAALRTTLAKTPEFIGKPGAEVDAAAREIALRNTNPELLPYILGSEATAGNKGVAAPAVESPEHAQARMIIQRDPSKKAEVNRRLKAAGMATIP